MANRACFPIRRDQCHPMTGYRTVIESLIALHEVPAGTLGEDRAYRVARASRDARDRGVRHS